eukprot:2082326-Amphidinium_carterae.1
MYSKERVDRHGPPKPPDAAGSLRDQSIRRSNASMEEKDTRSELHHASSQRQSTRSQVDSM